MYAHTHTQMPTEHIVLVCANPAATYMQRIHMQAGPDVLCASVNYKRALLFKQSAGALIDLYAS